VPSRQFPAANSESDLLPLLRLCYALRGRYTFPNVKAAMEKRLRSLARPGWIEAVTTLIYRSRDRHFRWHDSGDLQSIEHLRNIVAVCMNLPRILAANPGVPNRRSLSQDGRANSVESLHPIFRPPRRRSAAAPLWPPGKHRLVSRGQDSSRHSPLFQRLVKVIPAAVAALAGTRRLRSSIFR
jgi:Gene product 88